MLVQLYRYTSLPVISGCSCRKCVDGVPVLRWSYWICGCSDISDTVGHSEHVCATRASIRVLGLAGRFGEFRRISGFHALLCQFGALGFATPVSSGLEAALGQHWGCLGQGLGLPWVTFVPPAPPPYAYKSIHPASWPLGGFWEASEGACVGAGCMKDGDGENWGGAHEDADKACNPRGRAL